MMKPSTVITGVLMGMVLVTTVPRETNAGFGDFLGGLFSSTGDDLGDALANKAANAIYVDSVLEFDEHICNYQVKPKIKSWELYFVGTVYCPGWTKIRGESLTRSRTRVVNEAVEDFARKAVNAGIIKPEDATNWSL